MQFGSLITAMATPFKQDNVQEIDFVAVDKLVEHLVKTGSDSIIISGTTGESPTLTHEEEHELFQAARAKIDSLGADVKLIFGAGSNSTQTVINTAKKAEELGADGLLMVTPYYNKPSQAGLKAHFSSIAQATKLPIILYNVPSRCVIALEPESVVELARAHSNIVALKEASNNIDLVTAVRTELSSDEFAIYSGDDSLTLPMMAVGADGVISVASHIVGEDMKEMMSSFIQGELQKAQKINKRLFPLFSALFAEPNPTCIKAALGIMNIGSAVVREPLVQLDAEQTTKLQSLINSVSKPTV